MATPQEEDEYNAFLRDVLAPAIAKANEEGATEEACDDTAQACRTFIQMLNNNPKWAAEFDVALRQYVAEYVEEEE